MFRLGIVIGKSQLNPMIFSFSRGKKHWDPCPSIFHAYNFACDQDQKKGMGYNIYLWHALNFLKRWLNLGSYLQFGSKVTQKKKGSESLIWHSFLKMGQNWKNISEIKPSLTSKLKCMESLLAHTSLFQRPMFFTDFLLIRNLNFLIHTWGFCDMRFQDVLS